MVALLVLKSNHGLGDITGRLRRGVHTTAMTFDFSDLQVSVSRAARNNGRRQHQPVADRRSTFPRSLKPVPCRSE